MGRRGVVPRPRRGPRIAAAPTSRQLRWPDGVRCPRCDSADTARLEARKKFYCRSCRYHFSVTSGTLFHNSHLPTWKWFLTISLMIQSEDGLPANQLVELLGVTYKTAWFAEHRVRAALQDGRAVVAAVPGLDDGERRARPCLRAAARGQLPAARAQVPAGLPGRDRLALREPPATRTPSATRCSACSAAIRSRTRSSSPAAGIPRRARRSCCDDTRRQSAA